MNIVSISTMMYTTYITNELYDINSQYVLAHQMSIYQPFLNHVNITN
jgi:hypothetical protein